MRTISVSGHSVMIDDQDYLHVNQFTWHITKRKHTYYVFRYVKISTSKYTILLLHRDLMGCTKGDGKLIDHKDRNGLNCQRSNLRFCTRSQNRANSVSSGGSKFKGVSWKKSKGLWRTALQFNGKHIHVGYFDNEIDAAKAYNAEAVKYHKEFTCLNQV